MMYKIKLHPQKLGFTLDETYYIDASSTTEAKFILEAIINQGPEFSHDNPMEKRNYYKIDDKKYFVVISSKLLGVDWFHAFDVDNFVFIESEIKMNHKKEYIIVI